jgi:carbonic anhydrase
MTHELALKRLKGGNERFVKGESTFPRLDFDRRSEQEDDGQTPFATVIACSDSRVPTDHLFDQGVGDLFTVKVAGNICADTQIGSVEYAVAHLNTNLVVLLGHSNCGAIKASISGETVSGALGYLLGLLDEPVNKVKSENPGYAGDQLLRKCTDENINTSIKKLSSDSKIIADAVKSGKTRVIGAYYDNKAGTVEWYE